MEDEPLKEVVPIFAFKYGQPHDFKNLSFKPYKKIDGNIQLVAETEHGEYIADPIIDEIDHEKYFLAKIGKSKKSLKIKKTVFYNLRFQIKSDYRRENKLNNSAKNQFDNLVDSFGTDYAKKKLLRFNQEREYLETPTTKEFVRGLKEWEKEREDECLPEIKKEKTSRDYYLPKFDVNAIDRNKVFDLSILITKTFLESKKISKLLKTVKGQNLKKELSRKTDFPFIREMIKNLNIEWKLRMKQIETYKKMKKSNENEEFSAEKVNENYKKEQKKKKEKDFKEIPEEIPEENEEEIEIETEIESEIESDILNRCGLICFCEYLIRFHKASKYSIYNLADVLDSKKNMAKNIQNYFVSEVSSYGGSLNLIKKERMKILCHIAVVAMKINNFSIKQKDIFLLVKSLQLKSVSQLKKAFKSTGSTFNFDARTTQNKKDERICSKLKIPVILPTLMVKSNKRSRAKARLASSKKKR